MTENQKPATVESYISTFPDDVQELLQKVRASIRKVLPPEADEIISYGIPTFRLAGKYVVYYSGWKHHIALYPTPHGSDIDDQVRPYVHGKGTLQFPLDQPIPYDLIERVAKRLLEQHAERTQYQ